MLRKIHIYILLSVVGFGILAGCGEGIKTSKPTPQWVKQQPKPEAGYLYFVGMSDGSENIADAKKFAIQDAINQVFGYIGIKVKMQQIVKQKIEETDEAVKVARDIEKTLETGGKGNLNITVEDFYYEEKKVGNKKVYTYYVLLKASKKDLDEERSRIEKEMERKRRLAQTEIDKAKDLINSGEPIKALDNLISLYQTVLIPLDEDRYFMEAEDLILKCISSINLEKVKEVNVAFLGNETEAEFLVKATVDRKTPAKSVPLIAKMVKGEGKIEDKANTDEQGIAKFKVLRMDKEEEKNEVVIKVDITDRLNRIKEFNEGLASDLNKLTEGKGVTFIFRSADRAKVEPVAVVILSENPEVAEQSQAPIISALKAEGFNVYWSNIPKNVKEKGQKAIKEYLISKGIKRVVMVTINSISSIYNEMLESYVCTVKGTADILDLETDKVLDSYEISGKSASLNKDASCKNALQKISIKKMNK